MQGKSSLFIVIALTAALVFAAVTPAPCRAAPSYQDCVKSYNELKAAIASGADEKTVARLTAVYKEMLAAHEASIAANGAPKKGPDAVTAVAAPPEVGEEQACAEAALSKTMCELESLTRSLRYGYTPAKAEKIIIRLNEIIRTSPAGSPESERASFELAGALIKKKDYQGALKILQTLKTPKTSAVNDSDVKNLIDYASAMSKKKAAAAAVTAANRASHPPSEKRKASRISEGGPEAGSSGRSAAGEGEAADSQDSPLRFEPYTLLSITSYRPIAEWTGRLILPSPEQREPDGSVFIEVHNSPVPALIGKIIRLRWDASKPEDAWFEMVRTTVNFDPKRLESERANALALPLRLAGWPAVSPLESLAGARAQDDVEIALKDPVYADGSLYINNEPALICGSHFGLVRFEGAASGEGRLVRHYNPSSGAFDGPAETVQVLRKFELANLKRLVSSTEGIERSPLNEDGWYIYGTPAGGKFVVKALEPRRALSMTPSRTVGGKRDVKHYFAREHFDGLAPSTVKSTLVAADAGEWTAAGADAKSYADRHWPIGKKAVVIHLFGWHEASGEKKKLFSLPLVTGHFSFGVAEVVADPFTGEKRFNVEYKQVYAHNNTGIISGTHKWHSYMGDLKRGWMYTIPVSDTFIQVPELEPYDINGWKINPMRGFARMAEIMAAVYRTGGGSGISSVRPDVSCVQDSHYVLYGALVTFEKNIKDSKGVFEWLRGKDPMDADVMRFFGLDTLVSELKNRVTILGLARDDWKNNFDNPLGTRSPNVAEKTIRTLLSLKTVFPRDGNDNLIFFAANRNYRMWSVLTAMCGGEAPGLKPLAPNSILRR